MAIGAAERNESSGNGASAHISRRMSSFWNSAPIAGARPHSIRPSPTAASPASKLVVAACGCSNSTSVTSTSTMPSPRTSSQKPMNTMTMENTPYGPGPRIGARMLNSTSHNTCWATFSTVTQLTDESDADEAPLMKTFASR